MWLLALRLALVEWSCCCLQKVSVLSGKQSKESKNLLDRWNIRSNFCSARGIHTYEHALLWCSQLTDFFQIQVKLKNTRSALDRLVTLDDDDKWIVDFYNIFLKISHFLVGGGQPKTLSQVKSCLWRKRNWRRRHHGTSLTPFSSSADFSVWSGMLTFLLSCFSILTVNMKEKDTKISSRAWTLFFLLLSFDLFTGKESSCYWLRVCGKEVFKPACLCVCIDTVVICQKQLTILAQKWLLSSSSSCHQQE